MKAISIFLFMITGLELCSGQGIWKSYTPSNSGIPFSSVNSVEVDDQDHVWISNDNSGNYYHVSRFDGSSFSSAFQGGWVDDITVDHNDHVWISIMGELREWDGSTWHAHSPGLSAFWLWPIEADHQGNIWISDYFDKHIYRYDGSSTMQITTAMGLPSEHISCMKRTSNGIFIGTTDGGLAFYNGSTFTVYNTLNSALSSNHIFDMDIRNDTLFMILINSDLALLHNGTVSLISDPLLEYGRITIDPQGAIWIAAYGTGIIQYTLSGAFTLYDFSSWPVLDPWNQYHCIDSDQDGHIWVGSQQTGLLEFDPSGTSGFSGYLLPAIEIIWIKDGAGHLNARIHLPAASMVKLELFDRLGRLVAASAQNQHAAGWSDIPCSLGELRTGHYLFRLITNGRCLSGKVLVE
ncbi:MAG TPA: hypothetical protein P5531_14485 [Bacteroidales bacterium]|nr:hypothetical protein [Bacteroidales bacterium]HSA44819.1 hypothetical protein [Bacteroidales bacterium]